MTDQCSYDSGEAQGQCVEVEVVDRRAWTSLDQPPPLGQIYVEMALMGVATTLLVFTVVLLVQEWFETRSIARRLLP